MSTYPSAPQGYYDPMSPESGPPSRSGLAVTSLVLSLIGIIPCLGLLTAPIGVLLGLIGLVAIKPPKTGKGMAAAAVILGILFTGTQVYLGKKYVVDPIREFIALAMDGPNDTLSKGLSGDIAGFKSDFHGAGSAASNAEAQAFLDEVNRRYGTLQSVALPQGQQGNVTQPQFGQPRVPLPYTFTFSNKTLSGEVELIIVDETTGSMIKKLGYMKISDPDNGDLIYPPSDAGADTSSGSDADAGADADDVDADAPPAADTDTGASGDE